MESKKILGWLFVFAVIIAIIAGAITYGFLKFKEHGAGQDLQLARSFLDQKKFEEAAGMIDAIMARTKPTDDWHPVLLAMLELYESQGDDAKGRDAAEALLTPDADPKSQPVLRARIYLAKLALKAGKAKDGAAHYTAILQAAGNDGEGADIASYGLTRIRFEREGGTTEVQQQLADLVERYPNSEVKDEIEATLGEINMQGIFTQELSEGDELYVIKKGDSIASIAKKHKVSEELIQRVNGIGSARNLTIGRRLRIPKMDFSLLVDKSTNTMVLFNNGKFFKKYRVRTGKVDYMTPVGEYVIGSKVKNPVWKNPKTGRSFPAGDPENELGTRWMGFQSESSLGIHGTIKPETIGTYASNGCVGLSMPDVEELFDLVRIGTPIKIIGKLNKELLKEETVETN